MQDDQSARDLVESCRQGEELAYQLVYDRYSELLRQYARRQVGNRFRGKVDESVIVQSVFRRFFGWVRRRDPSINDTQHLENLLKRMTRNLVIKRLPRPEEGAPVSPAVTASGQALDLLDELRYLLVPLKLRDQQVICLRLEGHSTEEIAGRVGVSCHTVRRVLKHFRERLETQLDRYRDS